MCTDTDTLEALIRSLAAELSQPPIGRAELRIAVDNHELLAMRFKPEQVDRSTHVYPPGRAGSEPASVIDSMRIVVNKVEFHIWQASRKPTVAELDTLNAVDLEHPAITMPKG